MILRIIISPCRSALQRLTRRTVSSTDLPEEEKAKRLAAAEAKKAKQAERDEKILAEFNALREKYGRTLLTAEDMAEENKPAEAAEAPEAEAVETATETAEPAAEDKPDDGKTE